MSSRFTIIYVLLFCFLSSSSQSKDAEAWADSILSTLTQEERISQLIMVSAYSNKGIKHVSEIEQLIKDYKIGGLMFLQGGPVRQAKLTNRYQSISKTPLMIALDAEWGVSMRLDSSLRFPWQMTLGSIQNDKLIYEMGVEVARQCKLIGVNINFAPVVDVNFNPDNPIIGNRSFGENPTRVGELAIQYMLGLQDNRVLACAKHFPGHGDTDTDSHKDLPIIKHNKKRLDSVEIKPFKMLIDKGLGSIMVAHLYIPSLDDTKDLAVSLSPKVVGNMLKNKLQFEGLVVTDALNMKGVSKYYEPGVVDVKALLAGNDVLLFSEDVPEAIRKIKLAISDGEISQDEIDFRCRKILMTKYWMGLSKYTDLDLSKVKSEIITNNTRLVNRKLVSNSITLVQNYDNLIPLKRLDTLNIASISIGDDVTEFQSTLSKYAKIEHYNINEDEFNKNRRDLLLKLSKYDLVLVSIHKSNDSPWKSYKFSRKIDLFIQKIAVQSKVIVSIFANPYALNSFLFVNNFDGLIIAYQNSKVAQEMCAQSIFGGIELNGKLPVSTRHFPMNTGIVVPKIRLGYTMPEEFGVNESDLYKIDSIANYAILESATPSCQILIAKEGKIFSNKSYGYHTYENKRKLTNTDVFDIASITKIVSTIPLLMKMVDDEIVNINDSLSLYLDLDTSNKNRLLIKDILSHQARLKSWIPFYRYTLNEDTINGVRNLRDTLYDDKFSSRFPYKVAENIYLHYSYPDTMFDIIKYSKLLEDKKYKYSDLGYYLLQKIIQDHYSETLDILANKNFYNKLGMENLTYKPLQTIDSDRIVPTEEDYTFRSQLIKGYVHDMGAAMMGGVAGHAGIFSNTNDLAKLMQMYLNNGEYANERYISESTLEKFTSNKYSIKENRRGLGFDKPEPVEGGPTCQGVSLSSFGHTGFTGTIAWADPETELIYIFLSNRIHPDADNLKLLKMDIRTEIMKEIYIHFGN